GPARAELSQQLARNVGGAQLEVNALCTVRQWIYGPAAGELIRRTDGVPANRIRRTPAREKEPCLAAPPAARQLRRRTGQSAASRRKKPACRFRRGFRV